MTHSHHRLPSLLRASPLTALALWIFFSACAPLEAAPPPANPDWLVDPKLYVARVVRAADGREIELSNGLVRRVFRLQPDAATVRLDNLVSGESLLRSIRSEAVVEINGQTIPLGGLVGQPVHNFLKSEWLNTLRADPKAWHCVTVTEGKTAARFAWQPRREWLSSAPQWPPPGISLTFQYAAPGGSELSNLVLQAHYELDLIHLRRPDGNDWDGWMHVNAQLGERALAVVYNPREEPVERRLRLPLHYAGLADKAVVVFENGAREELALNRDESLELAVRIPAGSRTWVIITAP